MTLTQKRITFLAIAMLGAATVLSAGNASAQTPRPPTATPANTATPAPTAVPALSRLVAPVREQVMRGNITVQGSASIPNFARYELSYSIDRAGQPDRWVTLQGATQPVLDGTLSVWSTTAITNGVYALRLEVYDRANIKIEGVTRGLIVSNTLAAIGNPVAASNSAPVVAPAASSSRFPQIDFAAIPGGFMRGITWAGYAFALLAAYVVLKRLLWWLWRKVRPERVDYGR